MVSQFDTSSTNPVPIERKTGWRNSDRFFATHGATTASATSTDTAATPTRRRHSTRRNDQRATGTTRKTRRTWLSDRVRHATPIIAPIAAARPQVGRSITP